MEKMIMINIISSDGNMYSVRSSVRSNVDEFKELLTQIFHTPPKNQRLLYRGEILKDDRTLDSYGLQANHTIHLEFAVTTPPFNTITGNLGFQGLDRPTDRSQLHSLMMQTLLSNPLIIEHIIDHNLQLNVGFQRLDPPTGGDRSQLLSLMMQTLLCHPLIMNHMIDENPQLKSMFNSIPHLRDMILDPEVVRRLTSPQIIQHLMPPLSNLLCKD